MFLGFWYRQIWTQDLKNTAVEQFLNSNECASLSIDSVHSDNKYKNSTNRDFFQEITRNKNSTSVLKLLGLVQSSSRPPKEDRFLPVREYSLWKKIKATLVEYLKSQLGLQMNFKRKNVQSCKFETK